MDFWNFSITAFVSLDPHLKSGDVKGCGNSMWRADGQFPLTFGNLWRILIPYWLGAKPKNLERLHEGKLCSLTCVYREIFDLQSVFFCFKFQNWNISFIFWYLKCKCNMQKQVWILYRRESNLKMKSEQTPLPSENVVRWNNLYPVFLLSFNIVNIVFISLNTKISAEILVLMSVDLLKCCVFLLLLLLLQYYC